MSAADEFRHACGLCMEPYSIQRVPKILPCFHSFCQPCLAAVAAQKASATELRCGEYAGPKRSDTETPNVFQPRNFQPRSKKELRKEKKENKKKNRKGEQQQQDEEEGWDRSKVDKESDLDKQALVDDDKHSIEGPDGNHGNTFLCPTCRAPVNVPKRGVSALQTNFYLITDHKAGEDDSSSVPLCEMCQEGQEQEATHYCNTCQQRICRSCRRLHDLVQGARDHRVQTVQSVAGLYVSGRRAEGGTGTEVSKWCQYHPDQVLSFQCLQCKTSICLHCKLTCHESHSTEDMATAVTRIKEELSAVLTEANKQVITLDVRLDRLEQNEADVKRQKRDLVQQVNARFDTVRGWAERARDEFLQTLEAKEKSCLKVIHAEITSAIGVKETLSGLISRTMTTRKTSPGTQWVLAKNELQAALLDDDKLDQCMNPADMTQLLNQLDCVADQEAIDLDLTRVFIGQLSEERGTEAEEGRSLSFRGMATAVTKLEADVKALTAANDETEKVAFCAVLQNNYAVNVNNTMVFSTVKFNQGEGYNSTTGVFTAPVAGTYVFMATIQNANGSSFTSYIYLPGCNHPMTSTGSYCTANVVFFLDKGNTAYLRSSSHNITCQANGCMFHGYLLSPK